MIAAGPRGTVCGLRAIRFRAARACTTRLPDCPSHVRARMILARFSAAFDASAGALTELTARWTAYSTKLVTAVFDVPPLNHAKLALLVPR